MAAYTFSRQPPKNGKAPIRMGRHLLVTGLGGLKLLGMSDGVDLHNNMEHSWDNNTTFHVILSQIYS